MEDYPLAEEELENTHIRSLEDLIPPSEVKLAYPASRRSLATVRAGRKAVQAILAPQGASDRLVVVTGPCSIHDPKQALEYAEWLKEQCEIYGDALELIQRVYFEKPRTTVGWEGFINDPHLDESYDIMYGLMAARKLVCDITALGVPIGTELLDTATVQYYAGLVSWGAIGARTTESPLHRHLASGLSFPVGFKNATSGSVQIAADAVTAAMYKHHFPANNDEGKLVFARTKGNDDCHIILRGGETGPNYSSEHVKEAVAILAKAGLRQKLMIDASHANSGKDHRNQIKVINDIAEQVAAGSTAIMGVMIESNLRAGNQPFNPGGPHEYGVSITDACVDLPETAEMLKMLAQSVRSRRRTAR